MIYDMINSIKLWFRRKKYIEGKTISEFIARDIKREVLVLSTEKIEEGIISCQIKTTNVLYQSKGLVEEEEFSEPQDILIDELWSWSGNSWGGLADKTSLVNDVNEMNKS